MLSIYLDRLAGGGAGVPEAGRQAVRGGGQTAALSAVATGLQRPQRLQERAGRGGGRGGVAGGGRALSHASCHAHHTVAYQLDRNLETNI